MELTPERKPRMANTKRRSFTTDYRLNLLNAVIRHALPHRRKIGWFATFIISVLTMADHRGKYAFGFTHTWAAMHRHAHHRNTSREMLRELAELGLVRIHKYKPEVGNRVIINWAAVYRYAQDHAVKPLGCTEAKEGETRPATKAAWDAERARWKAEQWRIREAAEKSARDEHERKDAEARQGAATASERRQANEEWLKRDPRMAAMFKDRIATRQTR